MSRIGDILGTIPTRMKKQHVKPHRKGRDHFSICFVNKMGWHQVAISWNPRAVEKNVCLWCLHWFWIASWDSGAWHWQWARPMRTDVSSCFRGFPSNVFLFGIWQMDAFLTRNSSDQMLRRVFEEAAVHHSTEPAVATASMFVNSWSSWCLESFSFRGFEGQWESMCRGRKICCRMSLFFVSVGITSIGILRQVWYDWLTYSSSVQYHCQLLSWQMFH